MDFPDRDRHFEAAWDGDRMVAAMGVNARPVGQPAPGLGRPSTCCRTTAAGASAPSCWPGPRSGPGPRAAGSLAGEVFAPVDGTSPALEFATRHGFKVTIEDGMKVVDIPATRDTLGGAGRGVRAAPRGLRAAHGPRPIPDELVEGYCAVQNMFMSEAPTGDADIEDEVWDAARVRAEPGARRQGRAPGRHHLRPEQRTATSPR